VTDELKIEKISPEEFDNFEVGFPIQTTTRLKVSNHIDPQLLLKMWVVMDLEFNMTDDQLERLNQTLTPTQKIQLARMIEDSK
jgi:hypothetical protein